MGGLEGGQIIKRLRPPGLIRVKGPVVKENEIIPSFKRVTNFFSLNFSFKITRAGQSFVSERRFLKTNESVR